ncbi:MAG: hypothetical protein K8U57_00050 [Planctomycetes bacterium]|nr:hypothetical protein [Planctomycetota bacterium]
MAKPVDFAKRKAQASKGARTDFNFGFNALSKSGKKAYNKQIGRRGSAAGGLLMFTTSPPLAFGTIPRPAFARAAQHLPAHALPYKAKAEAKYRRAAKTAAELLPDLPEKGECVHALMLGTFDLAQVITAVVPRLPALRHLRIASLCYSKRNIVELCGMLDTRKGMALTLLVSAFHREHNRELHEWAVGELTAFPNVRVAAARTHCKVTLFDIADDDALVFEGSANLRTNKNREQLSVFRDRQLHDWHSSWIDELMSADRGEA